jgi:hypothetical protein
LEEKLAVQKQIRALESQRNDKRRALFDAQDAVDKQRDTLIAPIEAKLSQQGKRLGKDYFDELLERIRSIRASERCFYLKITDIYEQCSIDYNRNAEITQTFFKTVQNKLHWAITGKTAAELIAERAQADQPNMDLKTWKNAPPGRIQKADVSVAKNYLEESEIKALERIVSMYLDYAGNQAARQIPMSMADWVQKLDSTSK